MGEVTLGARTHVTCSRCLWWLTTTAAVGLRRHLRSRSIEQARRACSPAREFHAQPRRVITLAAWMVEKSRGVPGSCRATRATLGLRFRSSSRPRARATSPLPRVWQFSSGGFLIPDRPEKSTRPETAPVYARWVAIRILESRTSSTQGARQWIVEAQPGRADAAPRRPQSR